MSTLRIATRQSPLALWQARYVADRLESNGVATTLVPLVSPGDRDMRPIDGTRQVGLFTKSIQKALLDDQADIAVHSLKDLPTEPDPRFTLAAVPKRETVVDSLVSEPGWSLEKLPKEACVGTGSRRRAAQLANLRPDLVIEPIRGNVQTRLSKLADGEFDAIVLAEAGIVRLELDDLSRHQLPLSQMLPAPGQGALGIEVRSDDADCLSVVAQLDDAATRAAVTAERRLLSELHGGCLAPIAALGRVEQSQLHFQAVVLSSDGEQRLDYENTIELGSESWSAVAETLAELAAKELVANGAIDLIQENRPNQA